MTRRKKRGGPGKNQGGGGKRNPASLANLNRGGQWGNDHGMTHGLGSERLVANVEAEVRELMDLMAASAPVRDPADTIAWEKVARSLKRWRTAVAYNDQHGRIDRKGRPTPAAGKEITYENQLQRDLDSLGMNPMARSRLGLNIARSAQSFDLARQWAEDGDG